ncbi:MAG: PQQ-binding-like beta-propeller repeat protein [Actinophytocola sp.]|nr:PQQ-binding-like beta-propeller repeat protein [Actinophytocola sp.]
MLAVAAAGLLIWATSDRSATHSTTAAAPEQPLDPPSEMPAKLTELWRAASAATPEPVAAGATVVTGDGGAVVGRDALTGRQRWAYQRDLPLCTVGAGFSDAVAMYSSEGPVGAGCSEVTKLDIDTGDRAAQHNGDAQPGTRLLSDDEHLLVTGETLINVWSRDLIRTMEYGTVPAPVEPNRQPRSGCRYGSITIADGKVGVIERCPGDDGARLTVFETTNTVDGETRSDEPKVRFSEVLPDQDARVIAIAGKAGDEEDEADADSDETDEDKDAEDRFLIAVAFEDPQRLMIYDEKGKRRAQYALDLPEGELSGDPEDQVVPVSRTEEGIHWFTGSATIALAADDLMPQWTLRSTVGPTTRFAGQTLQPIRDGLAVIDENTGKVRRTVSVDRDDYRGPVTLGSLGPVLLEQRGETLVALR